MKRLCKFQSRRRERATRKMFHIFDLFVLFLVAALSSTTVVQPSPIQGPQYDNIYVRNEDNNKLFKTVVCQEKDGPHCKFLAISDNLNTDNNLPEIDILRDDFIDKEDNYNGEGFRQEQWHNYPRQLDRLQEFPYERHKLRIGIDNTNRDNDSENEYNFIAQDEQNAPNEIFTDTDMDLYSVYGKVMMPIDPFFVLKIKLSSLSQSLADESNTRARADREANPDNGNEGFLENFMNEDTKELSSEMQSVGPTKQDMLSFKGTDMEPYWQEDAKVKRTESVPVKKRLFSLWSRLQSMAPRGHELHHRRHLHAFMQLPAGGTDAGGTLTAEARAVMRPPGSPLRWG
ncbi:hypothetical protein EVAR_33712_1 [Eumeta japonica]|uniref:Uncharacterized protein n=1 Tax=Eumeta variegata TaxID=151549 RepID=A0A4C1VSR2_EUMVA|nr:hypothetical protein EVAR_33712_1 [Eumeta japonica]